MNVIQFENKQCEAVRRYLDSYLSDELLVETNHEVLKHLETCTTCSQSLESKRLMRDGLRRAIHNAALPPGLETKIRAQLRAGNVPQGRSSWFTMSIAMATVVVSLATGGWLYRQNQIGRANADKLLALGIRDHVVCAMGGHYPALPPDMDKVASEKNMGPRYANLVPEVMAQWKDMSFVEAHRCNPGGRMYPHVIMKRGATLVSLSLLEKQPGETFPKAWLLGAASVGGMKIYSSRQDEYSVAGFETAKHFAFVMTSLDEKTNLDLARKIVPGTTSVLQQMEVSRRRPETMVLAWLASGSFQQSNAFRQ